MPQTTSDQRLSIRVLLAFAFLLASVHADRVYTESFDIADGGYAVTGTTSWAWEDIASGPGVAHSGTKAWATNPGGDYDNEENGYLSSPEIDLSAYTGKALVVTWWEYLASESGQDSGWAEATTDGGATWAPVSPERSGNASLVWTQRTVVLDDAYATPDFRVRFRFRSDMSHTDAGFYVDDVAIDAVAFVQLYHQDFDTGNGGYSVGGTTSWAWGQPAGIPGVPHSPPNVWATNLSGFYAVDEDGYVVSPVIDASMPATGGPHTLVLSWWQHLQTEGGADMASVQTSVDGVSWQTVYGDVSGAVSPSWTRQSVVLDSAYAVDTLRVRFRLRTDGSLNNTGFALDDVELSGLDAELSAGVRQTAFAMKVNGAEPTTLRFGIVEGASDAFDTGVDIRAVATTGARVYFDAPGNQTPDQLSADFRGSASVTRWRLLVEVGAGRSAVTLSWDAAAVEAGKLLYLQPLGSESPGGPPLDMSTAGQTTVVESATFEIAYAEPKHATVTCAAGWNMVGLDTMTLQTAGSLFGTQLASPIAWYWDGVYKQAPIDSPLYAERGYWLLFGQAGQSNTVTGIPTDGTLRLQSGWNMVTPAHSVDLTLHPGLADTAWTWEPVTGAYVAAAESVLQPGTTYWVLVPGATPVLVP